MKQAETPAAAPANRAEAKVIRRPAHARRDCWNHIGVAGDGTCPELAQVIHCRNCPVYAAEGRAFFDRPPPEDYAAEWAARLASPEDEARADRLPSVVVFQIGTEWLALPTALFREVTEPRPVHRIPHRSNGVLLGLVNIRGEIQLCVSLGEVLGLEKAPVEQIGNVPGCKRMLVMARKGETWVFPVAEVEGARRFNGADVMSAPVTIEKAYPSFTRSIIQWGDKHVAQLDEAAVFDALMRSVS